MIIKASTVYYVTKQLLYHCVMSDELQPIAKNPLFLVHPNEHKARFYHAEEVFDVLDLL